MSEFFGIDFGTTNSATVCLYHGRPYYCGDDEGQPYPSLIAVDRMTGKVSAKGREAWKHQETLRDKCELIGSAKTLLGSDKDWVTGPRTWTPEDVVAEVLSGLKNSVSMKMGTKVSMSSAVVAIPVNFPPRKRKALRSAARKASVEITGFVSEPTAALFRHFDDVKRWSKVAVFDWGGGTLDISVVELRRNTVHEVATTSRQLGGDDLDKKIASWAHEQIMKQKGGATPFELMAPRHQDALVVNAESAKRLLSQENETSISVLRYAEFGAASIAMTPEILKSLLAPEIRTVVDLLRHTVQNQARFSFEELGCILMVGGSSKLCGLTEEIEMISEGCTVIPPRKDSDWSVGHGAALLGKSGGVYVASQGVGVFLSDDTVFPLFRPGDMIRDIDKEVTFGLVEDDTNARFIFVDMDGVGPGESGGSRGQIYCLDVPTFGFVREPIRLNVSVDENLLLRLSAKSENFGQSKQATYEFPGLRFSYVLPVE